MIKEGFNIVYNETFMIWKEGRIVVNLRYGSLGVFEWVRCE